MIKSESKLPRVIHTVELEKFTKTTIEEEEKIWELQV
jgi:hypothetical protein